MTELLEPMDNPAEHVLVVDDEPSVCALFKRVLERRHYQVDVAQNLPQALMYLNQTSYHAILVDVKLADDDGIDVLKHSLACQPQTPVIMVTGAPTVETATDAMRLGAYDYLSKPVTSQALISTVMRAAGLRHLRHENALIEKENRNYRENLERLALKRAEQIKEKEERYRTLFENSMDAIVCITPDGRLFDFNPAALELFGCSQDMMAIVRITDFYADPSEGQHFLRTIDAQGAVKEFEARLRKADGSAMDCLLTFNQMGGSDKPLNGYQGIVRDVTRKKRLESIAEAANLMDNIGYVFSGIRHEIGNPINSVKMTLTVLNKNLGTYSAAKVADFLQRSLAQLNRVEYLLKALRNFSIYERPLLAEVRLSAFLDNFLALVKTDLKQRGIRISRQTAPGIECVFTDARALHQVFLNLFTNAMDAVKERPAPCVEIRVDRCDSLVRLVVEDNGCGMSQAEIENLFKPFFTSKPDGTGLGLVIVRNMLTKMNGSIQIESKKGLGTRVSLLLPEKKIDV
jgi:PAS domain S-box-containing protein